MNKNEYEIIRDKYNELIEQCKSENYESIKDKNCDIKSPYLNSFKSYYIPPNNNSNDEGSKNELSEILCGCRFTSLIFLSELNNKNTFKKSFDMYSQNRNIKKMIQNYSDTNSSDEEFPLNKEGVFLIQVYQYYEDANGYSPSHSFVMDKKDNYCHVLSSWYGGTQLATSVIYTVIEKYEFYKLLNHLNNKTKVQQEEIFGENNYFKDNEKIIIKYLDISTIQPKRKSPNTRKNSPNTRKNSPNTRKNSPNTRKNSPNTRKKPSQNNR